VQVQLDEEILARALIEGIEELGSDRRPLVQWLGSTPHLLIRLDGGLRPEEAAGISQGRFVVLGVEGMLVKPAEKVGGRAALVESGVQEGSGVLIGSVFDETVGHVRQAVVGEVLGGCVGGLVEAVQLQESVDELLPVSGTPTQIEVGRRVETISFQVEQ
jgi:hypothetical protein